MRKTKEELKAKRLAEEAFIASRRAEWEKQEEDRKQTYPDGFLNAETWTRHVNLKTGETTYHIGGGREIQYLWQYECEVKEKAASFRWRLFAGFGKGFEIDAGFCKTLDKARRCAITAMEEAIEDDAVENTQD